MKYLKIAFGAILFYYCFVYTCSFDRESWIKNNDVNQVGIERQLMIHDLANNILKKGMTKSEIIKLLGQPHSDEIYYRLPKGVIAPDSILTLTDTSNSKEENRIAIERINNWYKVNGQPDTILLYPAGFSIMDQNFLSITLDGNNLVREIQVQQH